MPQTTQNTAHRIKPADSPPDWVIHLVNPVLAFLLRSPLHSLVSDQLMLLTITGCGSGTEYTFPVLYDRDGTTISVTSHGTSWWKNLRHCGQDVTVCLRGDERTGPLKSKKPINRSQSTHTSISSVMIRPMQIESVSTYLTRGSRPWNSSNGLLTTLFS